MTEKMFENSFLFPFDCQFNPLEYFLTPVSYLFYYSPFLLEIQF